SSPLAERQQKLRAIVDANFDFAEMSRSALGPHWRDLTDAQRQEFSQVFKTFIEDSYLSKINEFSAQKVDFVRATSEGGGQYAQVFTNVEQQGSSNLAINYRLLKEGGTGDWKVYDVTVDNISIIANYRNQFNRIINNKGYNTLVTDLKNKQAALAASLVSGQ